MIHNSTAWGSVLWVQCIGHGITCFWIVYYSAKLYNRIGLRDACIDDLLTVDVQRVSVICTTLGVFLQGIGLSSSCFIDQGDQDYISGVKRALQEAAASSA